MRAYCYWPFARAEDIDVFASIPLHDDELTLQVIDRPGAPARGTTGPTGVRGRLSVRADLPDVDLDAARGLRHATSRASTYLRRTRERRRSIEGGSSGPHGGPFDVVHLAFLNRFGDQVAVPRLRRRHAVVCSVHDLTPHNARLPPFVEDRVVRHLHRSLGHVMVHHSSLRTALIDDVGLDPARVHVVPHWITPTVPDGFRRALGAPPTVLFQGTFRSNKGLAVLLAAIDALHGTPIRFVIAGRGDPAIESAVRAAANRMPQLRSEVGWISPDRKQQLLLDADVAVLPYTSFLSQSGVLNDAFGAHLPVVASDVGALGDTVRSTGTGLVVAPDDASALAAAIVDVVGNTDQWGGFVEAAERVALDHSPERTGVRFREVYEIVRADP